MFVIKSVYFLFGVLIIIHSCGGKETQYLETVVPKIIDLTESVNPNGNPFKKFIENVDIIPLETNDKCILAGINKIKSTKNLFFIFDRKASNLFVFDKSGAFVRKIGKRGHGPSEYPSIADFDIDIDKGVILIYSNDIKKIFQYDLGGQFLKSFKVPASDRYFSILNNDMLAFYAGYYEQDFKNLVITNRNGKIITKAFEFPSSTPVQSFSYSGYLTNYNTSLLYSDATSPLIYEIDSSLKISPKYKIEFGSKGWPNEKRYEFDEFINGIEKFKVDFLNSGYVENQRAFFFPYQNENYIRYGIYLKESDKVLTYRDFEGDAYYTVTGLPLGLSNDDKFISEVNSAAFDYYGNKDPAFSKILRNDNQRLYEVLVAKKDSDNPILMVYNIKNE